MKIVTSMTVWNDSVGTRLSVTYSEINQDTGKIISDNKRVDRVITDSDTKQLVSQLLAYSQEFIDNIE